MGLTCTRCGSTHSEAPFLCSGGHHHDWVDAGAPEEAALSRAVVEASLALRPNDKSKYWPIDGGTSETIAWNVAVDKLRAFRERGK